MVLHQVGNTRSQNTGLAWPVSYSELSCTYQILVQPEFAAVPQEAKSRLIC